MSSGKIRLNTDTNFLKMIAIVSMLIDHLGARVFPQYAEMRVIGRLAFPLFAYCVAVGCVFTKNIGLYALRMALLAIVVQPLYVTAMGHQTMASFNWAANFYRLDLIIKHYYLPKPSILFTLLAGILVIWTLRDRRYALTLVLTAFIWYVRGSLDYGEKGVLLMVLFYALRDRPFCSFVWTAGFMVWWGVPALQSQFALSSNLYLSTQFYAVLALPLIYIPFHTGMRINKYFFYAFYPAHLALIYLLTM